MVDEPLCELASQTECKALLLQINKGELELNDGT